MKTAFAKDIPFIKKTCGKSPTDYEQEIIAKFEPEFIYGGFILPWAAGNTYFRLINRETGEHKDYKVKKLKETNGGELHQTENAVWLKLDKKASQHNKRLIGWVDGWKGRNKTKAEFLCLVHNETLTPDVNYALKDDCDLSCRQCMSDRMQYVRSGGRTREDVLRDKGEVILHRCGIKGYDFHGFTGNLLTLKDTRFKTSCRCHGVEWESELRRANTFTCPECIKEQLVQLTNRTYTGSAYFYIQLLDDKYIKFGITTRKPEMRMKEQERKSKFNHKLIFAHQFEEGWKAADIEHEIKQRFNCYAAPYKDFKDGWSETIMIADLKNLQQLIYDYLTNEPDEADMWVSPKDIFNEDTLEMNIHFYGETDPHPLEFNFYTEDELEAICNAL
ncbi:hypothetical protein IS300_003649 [Salmonella enterica]|nr:hypothetical protein [Salmonella enterica]